MFKMEKEQIIKAYINKLEELLEYADLNLGLCYLNKKIVKSIYYNSMFLSLNDIIYLEEIENLIYDIIESNGNLLIKIMIRNKKINKEKQYNWIYYDDIFCYISDENIGLEFVHRFRKIVIKRIILRLKLMLKEFNKKINYVRE